MKTYQQCIDEIGEYGVVQEIKHPVVTIDGLPHAHPGEVIVCETGELGQVFTIEEDSVKLFIFSKKPLTVGTKVARAGLPLSVPVGDELIGQIIDPLGAPIFKNLKYAKPKDLREIDQQVKRVNERARIVDPLNTGTSIVDLLIPLGKGQRELVIGDRKTGKTAFFNTIIKQQIQEGSIVLYVAIGKKKGEIRRLVDYYVKNDLLKNMIIVSTDSQDPSTLTYIAPLTAMTIAEYFRDKKRDVLVLFDDLSNHAKFYREVSLLSGRFPGRESYPGDIFYTHAKLLERAGNFAFGEESYSITCLPIVETVEGDLTGYIQTNLMGITDGHIFFDSNAYYDGRRPAINIGLSVTRAGKQTQSSLRKDISREVGAFLANYEKMQNFSHFGAELSPDMLKKLKLGEKMYQLFEQHYDLAIPETVQVLLVGLVYNGFFDEKSQEEMNVCKAQLTEKKDTKEMQKMATDLAAIKKLPELQEYVNTNLTAIESLCATSDKSTKNSS